MSANGEQHGLKMEVERLQNLAEERKPIAQLLAYPWRCCRCGVILHDCAIVGTSEDGTTLVFCGEHGEQAYLQTLTEAQRIPSARGQVERSIQPSTVTTEQQKLF